MLETQKINFEDYFKRLIHQIYESQASILGDACAYALLGKGQRLRPLLCILSHELASPNSQDSEVRLQPKYVLTCASALEMIHTYSLVHDDLPAMDDDDLRRGRPTVHKAFDEATAILVGDGLLTDAFSLILSESGLTADQKVNSLNVLAQAIGTMGMVSGQSLDINGAGAKGEPFVSQIAVLKTGKLMEASCQIGGIIAHSTNEQQLALGKIGGLLGLGYQLKDDILDGDSNRGKTSGKDQAQNKITFSSLYSTEECLNQLSAIKNQIKECLKTFPPEKTHNFISFYENNLLSL